MRKPSAAVVGTGYNKTVDTLGLYTIVENLDGSAYLWDVIFIHLVRYGLSTFCISEMSTLQHDLFQLYVAAVSQEIAHTEVTTALDNELVKIAICADSASDIVVCGNSGLHTYVACGIDINL